MTTPTPTPADTREAWMSIEDPEERCDDSCEECEQDRRLRAAIALAEAAAILAPLVAVVPIQGAREWSEAAQRFGEALAAYRAARPTPAPGHAEGLCECGHHASRHAIGRTCFYRTEGDPRFCRCSDFRPGPKE